MEALKPWFGYHTHAMTKTCLSRELSISYHLQAIVEDMSRRGLRIVLVVQKVWRRDAHWGVDNVLEEASGSGSLQATLCEMLFPSYSICEKINPQLRGRVALAGYLPSWDTGLIYCHVL